MAQAGVQVPSNGGNPSDSSSAAPGWDARQLVRRTFQPWVRFLGAVIDRGPFIADLDVIQVPLT
jgi:hypothetical protein